MTVRSLISRGGGMGRGLCGLIIHCTSGILFLTKHQTLQSTEGRTPRISPAEVGRKPVAEQEVGTQELPMHDKYKEIGDWAL